MTLAGFSVKNSLILGRRCFIFIPACFTSYYGRSSGDASHPSLRVAGSGSQDDAVASLFDSHSTHLGGVDQAVYSIPPDEVPATQNQAMNALVFLHKRVLQVPLGAAINAVRAERKANVPVVLTRDEVAKVIPLVEGVGHRVVKLLYGSGLRMPQVVEESSRAFVFGRDLA